MIVVALSLAAIAWPFFAMCWFGWCADRAHEREWNRWVQLLRLPDNPHNPDNPSHDG